MQVTLQLEGAEGIWSRRSSGLEIEFLLGKVVARDHVRDLHDLQLLIALMNAPDRWWDVRTAARELQVPDDAARAALEHLAWRNLLERYQFRPGSEQPRRRSLALAAAFAADPVEVVGAITHSLSSPPR